MQLDKTIQSRHSTREFMHKKPDWRKIIECIDSARYAPMAGNIFTLKFILVDNKEKIKKLSEAAQQPFISQANFVVVACSNISLTSNAFGKKAEIFGRQQAGAAIQNFLLKIEEAGLATCWIGHFVEEHVKRELKIPDGITVEAIFPIGYEIKKPTKQKKKINLDQALYFNSYGSKRMKPLKEMDV